jgi:transposase
MHFLNETVTSLNFNQRSKTSHIGQEHNALLGCQMRTDLCIVQLVHSIIASQWSCSRTQQSLLRMAPNLADSQYMQIRDMTLSNCPPAEIADVVGCSERSVFAIQSNIRHFGSTKAPSNSIGRPRSITPPILDALCEYLLEKPDRYREEIVLFVLDEFNTHITPSSIGRALKSRGWTKKTIRRIAKARNTDLRDLYIHNSWDSGFRS